jgi:tetratricopeptide (TPR) repeat protein
MFFVPVSAGKPYQVNFAETTIMKPYPVPSRRPTSKAARLLFLLGILLVISFVATGGVANVYASSSDDPGYRGDKDPQAKAALDDFYNLDYDRALSQFEKLERQHPQDPFAAIHLLQTVVFRELYRLNLLDTALYTHDSFITGRPANGDPVVKVRVEQLADQAVRLCNDRLARNPNDVDALYARGVAHGLRSTYVALVDKSFIAALRNAVAARRDHERVLEIDPHYTDAKTIVGAHNYVVGNLPAPVKMLAGMAGLGGSKEKGIQYLRESAKAGGESSADARVALALFLRREAKYDEASGVVQTLTSQYPRNYLFALEHCNLLKDANKPSDALPCFRNLLDRSRAGQYNGSHMEYAALGAADILRGQHDYAGALSQYQVASAVPNTQLPVKQRAVLGTGEMYDVLQKRDRAVQQYQLVIAQDHSSAQADLARKLLREPYRAQ